MTEYLNTQTLLHILY